MSPITSKRCAFIVSERELNVEGSTIDLGAAQPDTTPGGRKHKNMPFDYVENVRASLASSIATDVEDDFDGKANPIRMNSYNLSSSAGGRDQLDDEDDDNVMIMMMVWKIMMTMQRI